MEQERLFHDDIKDAIGTAVKALGGYKKVGHMLRPNMKMESAYAWLKECTTQGGDQDLDPLELMTLIRESRKVGCHSIVQYICQDASYEPPKPKEPEDEMAELKREFIESVKRQERIAERLGELAVTPVQLVKAAQK